MEGLGLLGQRRGQKREKEKEREIERKEKRKRPVRQSRGLERRAMAGKQFGALRRLARLLR